MVVGAAITAEDATGTYRYCIKVKRPSGGTKDSDLSLVHRCNLIDLVSGATCLFFVFFLAEVPYARMERTVIQYFRVSETQQNVRST
jgi:hypothetical protein